MVDASTILVNALVNDAAILVNTSIDDDAILFNASSHEGLFLTAENPVMHSDMVHLETTDYYFKRNQDDFFNLDCMYSDGN